MDTDVDRARWRFTLDYRFLPNLQLGLEYNIAAGELNLRGNWYLQTETARRPALILGTSSDRIGTPEGEQAYFLTAAKRIPNTPVAPYLSLNYSEFDDGFNFPFGASIEIDDRWSLLPMYDGQRTHLLGTYSWDRYDFTLIWVWLESLGVSVSARF